MAEREIQLEEWVYKLLKKFRNVALPRKCSDMPREKLIKHLSKKVGFKVKLRETVYAYSTPKGERVEHIYLMAEEI